MLAMGMKKNPPLRDQFFEFVRRLTAQRFASLSRFG
jgi:hypothetical protein